ncbi:DUF1810 domain-containing protein [Mucilaginibacter sp.]
MENNSSLKRFIDAQQSEYATALSEIENGRKRSHWMWYIFPQIQGLGFSSTSKYYAIENRREAEAYLNHTILGERLIEISNALLKLPSNNPHQIFGSPDDIKLKSCMTLFSSLPATNAVFQMVLNKFFGGSPDQQTLRILGRK